SARGPERQRVPPRTSRDLPLDRRVIREYAASDAAPLEWPADRRLGAETAHEDVVDPCRGRALEAPLHSSELWQHPRVSHRDVQVPAEDDRLAGVREAVDEGGGAQQLGVGESLVVIARRVEVHDNERRVLVREADDLAAAPLLRPGELGRKAEVEAPTERPRVEDEVRVLANLERLANEDRVRLACEGRAEDSVVDVGEHASDLGSRR